LLPNSTVYHEERERRAKELLEEFDLYERRHTKVQGFSRRMKRRPPGSLPLKAMPDFLRSIAYLMPLTYSVDAMRQTVLGPLGPLMLLGDMAALRLFLVLFMGVATMTLRRDIR
jgi:hypothetical protein